MKKNMKIVAALMAIGLVTPAAYATNGMNLEGYGPIAAAMGGASQAYDNGTAAMMNNPATLGMMADGSSRIDAAIGLLGPNVTANSTGAPAAKSSADLFIMPALGYATKKGSLTYGAGLFAQGGMGTEYAADSFLAAGSNEKVRSEVGVLRAMIPVAYQIDDKLTIGGSIDYVQASMDLKMAMPGTTALGGIYSFQDMVAPLGGTQTLGTATGTLVDGFVAAFGGGQITSFKWARIDFSDNNAFSGKANGSGMAGKLGATYKFSPALTMGASYHSKTSMGDLTTSGATLSMNLSGAIVGGGTDVTVPLTGSLKVKNFQWPETYGFGAAYQVNEQLMLVADYKHIGWKDVMKDFNVSFVADNVAGNGAFAGAAVDISMKQNWDDQNVVQIGGAYKTSPDLVLRAGLNVANNPVPDKYMNPLFPAIATTNVTLGAGYSFSKVSSIDFNYAYVPKITGGIAASGPTVDFAGYSAQLMYSHRI